MKTICIIGTGYVGLVTGTCFADLGNRVFCVDIDEEKIAKLQQGIMPIYEPGLEEMVRRNAAQGRLHFTTSYEEGIREAEFIFICVDTPSGAEGEADLRYVRSAAKGIGEVLDHPVIIVNRSTVPIGTGDIVADVVRRHLKKPVEFAVVSNPEFTREGSAVHDFLNPDRIVLGATDEDAAQAVAQLYLPLRAPIIITDLRTAEMIKYASNAFLATRLSFINEIASICEALGADIKEVAAGMGYDKRIGHDYLDAGLGWGGSCFAGDQVIFTAERCGLVPHSFAELFEQSGERRISNGMAEIAIPENLEVLSFDLATRRAVKTRVKYLTRRLYSGPMVKIRARMGREVTLTPDHPVFVYHPEEKTIARKFAGEVKPGDSFFTPLGESILDRGGSLPAVYDLADCLRDTGVTLRVRSTDGYFQQLYPRVRDVLPAELLPRRERHQFRECGTVSAELYLYLREHGYMDDANPKALRAYARYSSTSCPLVWRVDEQFTRFIGYYLAEGSISVTERGPRGGSNRTLQQVVTFSFSVDESEYIADLKAILNDYGIPYSTQQQGKSFTFRIYSAILVTFIRDVLGCGTESSNKRLPPFAFHLDTKRIRALLCGLFSGDGAISTVNQGRHLCLEYATTSPHLAEGVLMLLHALDVVPSVQKRWMNKSKVPAYILRVNGARQIKCLTGLFGVKKRAAIESHLTQYQRVIHPTGHTPSDGFAWLSVSDVQVYEVTEQWVYSLETDNHVIVGPRGIVASNCFPKDVKALIHMAAVHGTHPQLLRSVMEINRDRRRQVVRKLRDLLGRLDDTTIGILGLSFKPNTDDMREAPSIEIIHMLQHEGARIKAYDPVALENARRLLKDVILCEDAYSVAEGCDALVVVTEWNEFKQLDLPRIRKLMRRPIIIDGRNIYDPEQMAKLGFVYRGMGRGYDGTGHTERRPQTSVAVPQSVSELEPAHAEPEEE